MFVLHHHAISDYSVLVACCFSAKYPDSKPAISLAECPERGTAKAHPEFSSCFVNFIANSGSCNW